MFLANKKQENSINKKKKILKNKTKVLSIRITEIQHKALQARSKKAGMKISEFARLALLKSKIFPRLNREELDMIRKLSGEANNLNQICHLAHKEGFLNVARELHTIKEKIISIIRNLFSR